MANQYRGPERRHQASDHDTIIELVHMMQSYGQDLKELCRRFEEHTKDDADGFRFLNRVSFIGMGILGTLQFIIMVLIGIKF